MPEGAVYVGRGTGWGNVFRIGSTGWRPAEDCPTTGLWDKRPDLPPLTREDAVEAFRRSEMWHMTDPGYAAVLRRALRGRDLACWCPLVDAQGNRVPCHADVLLELANGADE